MTGHRKTRATRQTGKDVVQCAPNFTVYEPPPDVVSLYSEDRKCFLQGEVYVALAEAMGKTGKSLSRLVGDLERTFPSDQINEALKRLGDRRYIVPASPAADGTVAGYWASLGLPSEVAESNLQNCRVRIEAIDVKGATELGAALGKMGVRLVKNSPDLTITLVNDYFERQLAELNQKRVSDKTPWLLVQPSGVFPLVGPVFKPGESPCWTWLFYLMIPNRHITACLQPRS